MLSKDQIEDFLNRLYGPEGCNFHYEGEHKSENFRWRCNSADTAKPLSRAILKKMGVTQEAADEFLDWCTKHGGACDCEILWNCVRRLEDEGLIDSGKKEMSCK